MSSDAKKKDKTPVKIENISTDTLSVRTESVAGGSKLPPDKISRALSSSPTLRGVAKCPKLEPLKEISNGDYDSDKEKLDSLPRNPRKSTSSSISSKYVPNEPSSMWNPSASATKGKSKGSRPIHQHRLIRQNSLAAVLGLFRSNTNREDDRGVSQSTLKEWGVVIKEESEDGEKSTGSNASRSLSIPSSTIPLPSSQLLRKNCRRSSIHTDLADGTFIMGSVPAVLAIKKKSVDAPKATNTRRCSLTLPYANLYGSWQMTIPVQTCNENSEATLGAAVRSKGGATNIQPEVSIVNETSNHRNVNFPSATQKQYSIPYPTKPELTTSPSTLPLLTSDSSFDNVDDVVLYPNRKNVTELLARTFQKVPMKDFGSEVRATLDIEHFLQSAVLHIDVQETSLEGVTDLLLEEVLAQDEPLCTTAEAKSILFTHDAATTTEKDCLSQVHLLARTIQGTACTESGSFDYDQSWVCALGNLPSLQRRHVAIARLKQPANMGRTSKQVKFFILILCPSKEKGTKNSLETGRTFATIFADMDFRQTLLESTTTEEFKKLIITHSQELAEEQQMSHDKHTLTNHDGLEQINYHQQKRCLFARGIREDLERRLPHYISDYKDGVTGNKTIQKVVSTTLFLYFACILPAIAFGVLNDHNTHGKIDVKRVIIGQVIGGLIWGLFSGQPLLVQLTTAPLAIYIKIIYHICQDFNLDFSAMYCAVGLWNSLFLIIYSLFDVSRLMRWSTRSTEEIFALFISIAFCNDAFNDVRKNFMANYYHESCTNESSIPVIAVNASDYGAYTLVESVNSGLSSSLSSGLSSGLNSTLNSTSSSLATFIQESSANATLVLAQVDTCTRENSILYLLLMFGTLWFGVMLYNFNKTPYLNANKRELLADYALPVAVIVLSFIGSYIFRDVKLKHFRYDDSYDVFVIAPLNVLPLPAVFASMGLGFSLSVLFFMDQNIGSAMVNNPCNKLKKGPAYHLDLFVVGVMNGFLSLFGLPWMHACLPHSPLHVRSLADVEERVDQGHVYEIIVKVRETRLTGLFSNILIGLSVFLLPYPLAYIPTAVLDGLFLYMAVTALNGNQMFERIILLFMEQAAYPPNHYIRRVPQRNIHKFTCLQVIQLLVMCSFGFGPWPYMKMMFPVLLLLLLPIRHRLVPMFIEGKYLAALDGQHQ